MLTLSFLPRCLGWTLLLLTAAVWAGDSAMPETLNRPELSAEVQQIGPQTGTASVTVHADPERARQLLARLDEHRIRPGWSLALRVPQGCVRDECLHWVLTSADGAQRVERMPAVPADVPLPQASHRDQIDPAWVRRHAEEILAHRFPDARAPEFRYYDYDGTERTAPDDLTVSFEQGDPARPVRVELNVWLRMERIFVMPDDAAGQEAAVESGAAWFISSIRSAPAHDFDADKLRSAQSMMYLDPEGWDQEIEDCLHQARYILYQDFIGARQRYREVEAECYRQWELRRAGRG